MNPLTSSPIVIRVYHVVALLVPRSCIDYGHQRVCPLAKRFVTLLKTCRLYEIIGDGEVWSLPEYAARHFEQHKRPLRIAVDEA